MVQPMLVFLINGSDHPLQSWRTGLSPSESVYFGIPFANFKRVNVGQ